MREREKREREERDIDRERHRERERELERGRERSSHLPAGAEEPGGGALELVKCQAAVAVGVKGPHTLLHLVKNWSNTGHIMVKHGRSNFGTIQRSGGRRRWLVKYWSNTGQILVKCWSNKFRRPSPSHAPPPGQTLVKHWSNTGQTRSVGQTPV